MSTTGSVSNKKGLQEYIDTYSARMTEADESPDEAGYIIEEMIGDFMGDNFGDLASWKAIAKQGMHRFTINTASRLSVHRGGDAERGHGIQEGSLEREKNESRRGSGEKTDFRNDLSVNFKTLGDVLVYRPGFLLIKCMNLVG